MKIPGTSKEIVAPVSPSDHKDTCRARPANSSSSPGFSHGLVSFAEITPPARGLGQAPQGRRAASPWVQRPVDERDPRKAGRTPVLPGLFKVLHDPQRVVAANEREKKLDEEVSRDPQRVVTANERDRKSDGEYRLIADELVSMRKVIDKGKGNGFDIASLLTYKKGRRVRLSKKCYRGQISLTQTWRPRKPIWDDCRKRHGRTCPCRVRI